MVFVVAGNADFSLAGAANTVFLTAIRARGPVEEDIAWFYPGAAVAGGAVEAIFGGEFSVFFVPFVFEAAVEEVVDFR